ncbi:DUF1800 family protein [Pedobacter sp. SYSU D00535]|uniref:DUF1800 domain-containing protein n=1 Tax=Pedobacter sp. SYSU D00535 TaxID=2810308 RepID=UPI001A957AC1|nr:DUF1800 domain-containing protein [Pedobacter sp. SYSU D00535]
MLTPYQTKLKHLHSRAGFGISFENLTKNRNGNIHQEVKEIFKASAAFSPIQLGSEEVYTKDLRTLSEEERRMALRQAREGVRLLNTTWLKKMASAPEQLREKMTLFWHGHFACRSQNPIFLEQLNNIHRKHALGNFREMVLEVAKAPAMLQFLNNQQNRKGHPNENFARELMELFTIGRGNYTEDDVKESARAFTGWSFNREGKFQFRPSVHDAGEKVFLGKQGNFGGEEIIDILLQQPKTAESIAGKVYIYLVNDEPDRELIRELGRYFYKENYEIGKLVSHILTSPWFYEVKNQGGKIKSPAELLTGLTRTFNIKYENDRILLQLQNALGQTLFYPPNVAGWPGGRNWIDSSSLMLRLKIPSLILNEGEIDFSGKPDPEDEAEIAMNRLQRTVVRRRVAAKVGWEKFSQQFSTNTPPDLLAAYLLQVPPSSKAMKIITSSTDLKEAVIQLASTPEFQLI